MDVKKKSHLWDICNVQVFKLDKLEILLVFLECQDPSAKERSKILLYWNPLVALYIFTKAIKNTLLEDKLIKFI